VIVAVWAAAQTAAVIVGVVGVISALLGIWINGLRAERLRRREFYSDALEAVLAYQEFAYVVRRRNKDEPGEERVRISEALREIQRDLNRFSSLMEIERDTNVAVCYRQLVQKTREIAGGSMRQAWKDPPIDDDAGMNISGVDLSAIDEYRTAYLDAVKNDLPWWKFWR
jgi:hypothetical protein